ncbi:ester cyclase [Martelella alba]|nr:ester cyclase [Martelella alba]
MLSSSFGEFRIEILDVLAQGDRVAVRAAMSGVHQGELFGIPPTGRTFTVALHEFHEFRDGRVAKTWHMEDWFSLFNQIGAFPSPGK